MEHICHTTKLVIDIDGVGYLLCTDCDKIIKVGPA